MVIFKLGSRQCFQHADLRRVNSSADWAKVALIISRWYTSIPYPKNVKLGIFSLILSKYSKSYPGTRTYTRVLPFLKWMRSECLFMSTAISLVTRSMLSHSFNTSNYDSLINLKNFKSWLNLDSGNSAD